MDKRGVNAVEVEVEARKNSTDSKYRTQDSAGNTKITRARKQSVQDVTERKEEFRIPHGVEKENAGPNGDRAD